LGLFFLEYSCWFSFCRIMSAISSQRRVRQRTEAEQNEIQAKIMDWTVIAERNVVRVDIMVPPLNSIHETIQHGEGHQTSIKIGALGPAHRMLAKIILHNLWPVTRRSNLILKKTQFVYVVHFRFPFCLCKHILGVMLEARDEGTTGLPFGCLLTQIILQSGINVDGEPRMKMK
jgi:hypothetical protein